MSGAVPLPAPRGWAAIFDWDGVVINSAPQHEASWQRLAAEEHLRLPAGHFARGFGMKNEVIIPELLGWTREPAEIRRLSDRKEALYRQIIDEHGIDALPGVREWLARLRAAGVPCAIGSSTPRANIAAVIARLGLAPQFAATVASEDVDRGKPDPQVFLLAASRLGAACSRCVVFEDRPVGIQAGKAAGMRVVAVTTSDPPEHLVQADRIVPRLDELTLDELDRWFA